MSIFDRRSMEAAAARPAAVVAAAVAADAALAAAGPAAVVPAVVAAALPALEATDKFGRPHPFERPELEPSPLAFLAAGTVRASGAPLHFLHPLICQILGFVVQPAALAVAAAVPAAATVRVVAFAAAVPAAVVVAVAAVAVVAVRDRSKLMLSCHPFVQEDTTSSPNVKLCSLLGKVN